eukprot:7377520-Prymnesium_polylepis.1
MQSLCHDYATQVCESINSLHIALHPKRRDLSRTGAGRAIHKLTSARFNDGVLSATRGVLGRLGLRLGRVGEITLAKHDHAREVKHEFKSSLHGKGKRKAAKKRRTVRDDKDGAELGYAAGVSLTDGGEVDAEGGEESEEGEGEKEAPPPAKPQRKCGICRGGGHNRKTCPRAPRP